MSVHRYFNAAGHLRLTTWDNADDLPAQLKFRASNPFRWKQIPEGYGEWSGRFTIVNPFNETPWNVLPQHQTPPPVRDGITDYEMFVGLYGDPPRGHTLAERVTRQQWFDRLLDWGGVVPPTTKNDENMISFFEAFELGAPILWFNQRAGKDSAGEIYMFVPAVDRSIPVPQLNAVGHAIAALQYEAFLDGQEFTNIHPFAKALIG